MRIKLLILIPIVLLSFFSSFKLLSNFSEKYFFDKFYYYKSASHGYVNPIWNPLINGSNPSIVEERIKDLRALIEITRKDSEANNQLSPSNYFRIAIIGDSMVYGLGIRNNERFSYLLEQKLNKIKPTKAYILAQPADG